MALSDKEIIQNHRDGNIVIEPFDENNLSTASYDVTLGQWFFREQEPKDYLHIYNIYDKKHTHAVWGTEAQKAQKAKNELEVEDYNGIDPDDQVILISPGETILAHTQEFIGGRKNITTMMKARSSLGRNFIEICKCAGWGDVGYTNRWTMEITNNSRHYSIPLVVGRRVAQIIFFETGEIRSDDYTVDGKYDTADEFQKLKKEWNPQMMLPKLYKDNEVKNND